MTQEMAQRVPDAAERVALKLEEFLPYRLNVSREYMPIATRSACPNGACWSHSDNLGR